MANLYTKTGDKGTTGLVGGNRVSKSDPRVNCYGIVDETTSMLGLAYSFAKNEYIRECIHSIQNKLFTLGAELASDEKGMKRLGDNVLHEEDVKALEKIVDFCTETTGKQTAFVVPGVNQCSAALHVARTMIRRAERAIIAAQDTMPVREIVLSYVNRLSDAIYALARLEETEVETKDLRDQIEAIIKSELGIADTAKADACDAATDGAVSCRGDFKFSLDIARELACAAEAKSREINVPVVFTAVDNGGNVMLLHRMDGSLQGSIDISMNKAYTANAFKMSTKDLSQHAQPGGSLYGIQQTNNGKVVIFGGGYPLVYHGEVVGAVGVSGGTEDEDMTVAKAAVQAFDDIKANWKLV
ncbi:MAG: cob(I)yrinic acid a,c-diamide adenosyltransferase [Lachnospiraceae bacterium]|nr:cob(I)yrinic acid a,c-diamide adenosyltransferase [Lachnospiraceae bacterium]